jgi:hypothetical protein
MDRTLVCQYRKRKTRVYENAEKKLPVYKGAYHFFYKLEIPSVIVALFFCFINFQGTTA